MPPSAVSNRPALLCERAREGALHVAEQLGFEQHLRDRRAVHDHERPVATLAARVDRARDHLLAGPALAADQDVRLAVGHLPDQLEDALHRRAVADDGAIALAVPQLAAQAPVLAREQLLLERLLDDDADLVDLEGLGDVVVGAFLHRADRRLGAREGGDHDDDRLGRDLVRRAQQIEPRAARHLDVRDHDVELVFLEMGARGVEIPGRDDVVALAAEEDLEEFLHAALVVDDEDASLRGHGVAPTRGRRTRTVVPTPSVLSTRMLPPCCSTIR